MSNESGDLIDFGIIETHKENIQSLPSGRSAKALAQLYSPVPNASSSSGGAVPSSSDTQDLNDATRQEYEKELSTAEESDDPLDIWDRYVRWTLDAYPSAQATPQSQLLPLLERATKALLNSPQYKNDPRYLKLWLRYIQLFVTEDSIARETFAFIARHSVGERLALFYEEFAAWLEARGRWSQAEEVFGRGIDKDARPAERLRRKYAEFQWRFEQKGNNEQGPSSPALPTVRPALAAKIDPFASVAATSESPSDPQANDRANAAAAARSGRKNKLAVFSDGDEGGAPGSSSGTKGWDSIGSLAERRKENTVEAKPWAGEKLSGGVKTNTGMPKMMIFKDESRSESIHPSQKTTNPRTGRTETVFVNLEAVYPDADDPTGVEYCFEELRAQHRGLFDVDWSLRTNSAQDTEPQKDAQLLDVSIPPLDEVEDIAFGISKTTLQVPLRVNDENALPSARPVGELEGQVLAKKMRKDEKANRTRKIRIKEVAETQTIQTNLDSPTGKKIRKRKAADPTMTFCTREAMDEIYGIFNQPLKSSSANTSEAESEVSEDEDDDYTSAGESTGTGIASGPNSEFGDTTTAGDFTESKTSTGMLGTSCDETSGEYTDTKSEYVDTKSVSPWSEFSTSKHVPKETLDEDDEHTSDAGDDDAAMEADEELTVASAIHPQTIEIPSPERDLQAIQEQGEEVMTPTSPNAPADIEVCDAFIPELTDDFNVPTQPFRNAHQVAQNRLPFMTPILEKTESSLGAATIAAAAIAAAEERESLNTKTPCATKGYKTPAIIEIDDDDEGLDSPFRKILKEALEADKENSKVEPVVAFGKKAKAPLGEASDHQAPPATKKQPQQPKEAKDEKQQGPIITDLLCHPVHTPVKKTIMSKSNPPMESYDGFFDYSDVSFGKTAEMKRFAKAVASKPGKSANEKILASLANPPLLKFGRGQREYSVRRVLGEGSYAPVYLAESKDADTSDDSKEQASVVVMGKGQFDATHRAPLEAIKMEEPRSAWEFYMIRQTHRRLGLSRAAESIVRAHEFHLYHDECFLVEEYKDQGTLLDLINISRSQGSSSAGGMDELLAMFFAVELFRTVEALHSKGVLHGDIKEDNILCRFGAPQSQSPSFSSSVGSASGSASEDAAWSSQYRRDGGDGWASQGMMLIDFGRGIDVRAFRPDAQFVADWEFSEFDCLEMREMRPWTYQIDYHGLACVLHTALFGRRIEMIVEKGGAGVAAQQSECDGLFGGPATGGAGTMKRSRIKESLKRYWQTDIWNEAFDMLLNPLVYADREVGGKMPLTLGMKGCREKMEDWLEANCEKGVGLKGLLRRMDFAIKEKKRGRCTDL